MKQTISLLGIAAICTAPLHTQDAALPPAQAVVSALPATSSEEQHADQQLTEAQQHQLEQIQEQQHAMVPPGTALITDRIPDDIQAELKKQWATQPDEDPDTISSMGEHPPSKGGQQCPYAAECGKRYAFGIGMMAWGAALAGAIGVIVWLGMSGKKCTPPSS